MSDEMRSEGIFGDLGVAAQQLQNEETLRMLREAAGIFQGVIASINGPRDPGETLWRHAFLTALEKHPAEAEAEQADRAVELYRERFEADAFEEED